MMDKMISDYTIKKEGVKKYQNILLTIKYEINE